MNEEKKTLRTEARRHRSFIDSGAEDIDAAADYFFSSINPVQDQVVVAYWPKGREFSPYPIIERLLERGNVCGLPVSQEGSKELRFAKWDGKAELTEGKYGVLHPEVNDKTIWLEPDIVIVPLLAFDRRGYRLGQGGGYYDATLASLRARKEILAVGVGYGAQAVLFNLPVEEHDQRLDWVITPKGTHYFE